MFDEEIPQITISMDAFIQFWLPAIAIGAAFAIVRHKDGQLTGQGWLVSGFGMILCSAIIVLLIGAAQSVSNMLDAQWLTNWLTKERAWAILLSGGALLFAFVDRQFDREIHKLRRKKQ